MNTNTEKLKSKMGRPRISEEEKMVIVTFSAPLSKVRRWKLEAYQDGNRPLSQWIRNRMVAADELEDELFASAGER